MRRGKLKVGVYEEKARPTCTKCGKKHPDCKHIAAPKKVVFLAGPDQIWAQLNGTWYPSVRFKNFNDSTSVEMVMPENQFRDRYKYLGQYVTVVNRVEEMRK